MESGNLERSGVVRGDLPRRCSGWRSAAGASELQRAARPEPVVLPRLSDQLQLDELWDALGSCLTQLARTPDQHAVLLLQPTVEAFFLVHAGKDKRSSVVASPHNVTINRQLTVD